MTDAELRRMSDRQLEALIEDAEDELARRRWQFNVVVPQLQTSTNTLNTNPTYVPGWLDSDEA